MWDRVRYVFTQYVSCALRFYTNRIAYVGSSDDQSVDERVDWGRTVSFAVFITVMMDSGKISVRIATVAPTIVTHLSGLWPRRRHHGFVVHSFLK
jgi:hypothetical protein